MKKAPSKPEGDHVFPGISLLVFNIKFALKLTPDAFSNHKPTRWKLIAKGSYGHMEKRKIWTTNL